MGVFVSGLLECVVGLGGDVLSGGLLGEFVGELCEDGGVGREFEAVVDVGFGIGVVLCEECEFGECFGGEGKVLDGGGGLFDGEAEEGDVE